MDDLQKCVDEIVMPTRIVMPNEEKKKKKMKRKYVAKGFIDTCTRLKLTAHVSRETNERIIFCHAFDVLLSFRRRLVFASRIN